MASPARGLLDRLNSLMVVNVAVIDDRLIDDADVLRLVDIRHISEAIELARVLFSSLGGSTNRDCNDGPAALPAGVTAVIGSSGRSCWVRHVLLAVAHENQCFAEDALSKSFRGLLDVLRATKRAVADYRRNIRYRNEKQAGMVRRVRGLPDAYREFYALVDTMLATRR